MTRCLTKLRTLHASQHILSCHRTDFRNTRRILHYRTPNRQVRRCTVCLIRSNCVYYLYKASGHCESISSPPSWCSRSPSSYPKRTGPRSLADARNVFDWPEKRTRMPLMSDRVCRRRSLSRRISADLLVRTIVRTQCGAELSVTHENAHSDVVHGAYRHRFSNHRHTCL